MSSLPIESIETLVIQVPTRADFRWNGLDRPLGEVLVARVRSGNFVGYGETVPLPDWGGPHGAPFGETADIDQVILHDLVAGRVLGRDGAQLAETRAQARGAILGYPYALGAFDIALHDLVARSRGVPLFDLLGGRRRAKVPIAHMIGLMEADTAQKEAEDALAEGCRAFQVKGGQDIRRDVELIGRLREVGGPEISLRLDANCGYGSWKTAAASVRALAEAGATMVEQPVGDREALRRVTEDAPIPIVVDEACWFPEDAVAVVRESAADALSVYVAKAGGVAGAATMTQIAAAAGMPHDLNGSLEAGIGNAASLHVAVASDASLLPSVLPVNGPANDLPTQVFGRYFTDDVIATGMKTSDGAILVGDAPGLGIDVDEDKLERLSARHRRTTVDSRDVEEVGA